MALPSLSSSPVQDGCIDPRLLVFGSGGGFDDPTYNNHVLAVEDTIELENVAQTHEQDSRLGEVQDLAQQLNKERNAAQQSDALPNSAPPPPRLDPAAREFVPSDPTATEPGLETLQHVQSAPTPIIKISEPSEAFASGRAPRGARRKSGSQSRQSSPGGPRARSSSIGRPRAQSKSRKYPMTPKAFAAQIGIALDCTSSPGWLAQGYNVGDRVVHPVGVDQAQVQRVPYGIPSTLSAPASISQVWCCTHPDCPDVGKTWDTRSERDHHERKHMPEDQRPHACDQCSRAFVFPKDLERHVEAVHKGTKVFCTFCGKPYSRQDNLKRHVKNQHKRSQSAASSPTASSIVSSAQSPGVESGYTTPLSLSPQMARSAPGSFSSKMGSHRRYDSVNEQHNVVDCYSPSDSPLDSRPDFRLDNGGL